MSCPTCNNSHSKCKCDKCATSIKSLECIRLGSDLGSVYGGPHDNLLKTITAIIDTLENAELPSDGNGIESAEYTPSTGVLKLTFTDGTSVSTGDLRGDAGQSIDHVAFTSSNGTPTTTPNQPGKIDTYTVWGDTGETISLATFTVYNGNNGAAGQGIHHTEFTTSTGSPSTTPNQPGEVDTYTIWGDAGETINLGTFTVYNGNDSALPYSLTSLIIDQDTTDDPTVVEQYNDIVTPIVYDRLGVGTYKIDVGVANLFSAAKTHILMSPPSDPNWHFSVTRQSTSIILIETYDNGALSDSLLTSTYLEIKIYP